MNISTIAAIVACLSLLPLIGGCGGSGGSGSAPATTTFPIGGTITGLGENSGLVLTAIFPPPGPGTTESSFSTSIPANATTFSIDTQIYPGSNGQQFVVSVTTAPASAACNVANGSGVLSGGTITNVAVTCTSIEPVLYSFTGGSNGVQPQGSLIQASDGNFYGTTVFGGSCQDCGTVFKITPTGVLSVLHSFLGGVDGSQPVGSLIQANDGNLYGMTSVGGTPDYGTVFKITQSGAESTLYAFLGGSDGSLPYGNLVEASDGNFYGTTGTGGIPTSTSTTGGGTVFKLTPAGVESVLHAFAGGSDGASPYGSLIQASDGNFYGTTTYGGMCSQCGTVFRITPSGVKSVLYAFLGGNDGSEPQGTVVQATDGDFYGTTALGGSANNGTVFKITPDGVESVLHAFLGGSDGAIPTGALIQASDGNFYGITSGGGGTGNGVAFEVTPTGVESVLHSFMGPADASSPQMGNGLIQASDGIFYGMTVAGGTRTEGAVFTIKN